MPNLKMTREEKLDMIRLARFLERRSGKRHGNYYSKNAGSYRDTILMDCPGCYYLLHPEYKLYRDGIICYSRGWGWRVRKGWRDTVKGIECTNQRIYKGPGNV